MLFRTQFVIWTIKRVIVLLCCVIAFLGLFVLSITNQTEDLTNLLRSKPMWQIVEKEPDWGSMDLFHLRDFEKEAFLSYKENVYSVRQNRVSNYCHFLENKKPGKLGPSFKVRKDSIIYDHVHRIGYCQIPKVASSTWCKHFSVLSGISPRSLHEWRNAIQILAPEVWPLPRNGQSLPDLFRALDVSLVIVRHPFARLASVYYEKLVFNSDKSWDFVNDYIITTFRNSTQAQKQQKNSTNNLEKINSNIATPGEFLLYVLQCLDSDKEHSNPHWLPQHMSCPFCLVNFTVYSKMEEIKEDTAYVMYKAKLIGKILPDLRDNASMKSGDGREVSFWQDVSSHVIEKLQFHYQEDLDMFDYTVEKYFSGLQLTLS